MTDPLVLYPSLFVGLVLVLIHLFYCHRQKRTVNLAVMTSTVLSGGGVVCGVLLIVGSFYKPVMDHLTGINIYIFIAGLAVCFVSARAIHKDIFSGQAKDGEDDGNIK